MQIRCREAFGNFKPGDVVEVPDGALFDHTYFEMAKPSPEKASDSKESK